VEQRKEKTDVGLEGEARMEIPSFTGINIGEARGPCALLFSFHPSFRSPASIPFSPSQTTNHPTPHSPFPLPPFSPVSSVVDATHYAVPEGPINMISHLNMSSSTPTEIPSGG
jgi:hypothetical protein